MVSKNFQQCSIEFKLMQEYLFEKKLYYTENHETKELIS